MNEIYVYMLRQKCYMVTMSGSSYNCSKTCGLTQMEEQHVYLVNAIY